MRLAFLVAVSILLTGCKPANPAVSTSGATVVRLTSSKAANHANPTDVQVRDTLRAIQGDAEGFASLARDDMSYIQVASNDSNTFFLEYQEGDVQKHFESNRKDLSYDEVTRAFIDYRDGKIKWADYGSWSKLDL